ncbi:DGQHR domain-containing protein [Idiomarina sp. A28L]|uniref:DGQHR domain-containing protein n=1 Tax=Idiomarina sp. A28L TaxID=1036674 RepID=UPI0002138603|nr:DGQHR domain-containing protein [Idiomarina sp. A28L]EGN74188.1 DGQHR domain-containing protein [Idiomarina sp. A28L]
MNFNVINFEQPIGNFFMTAMPARFVSQIMLVKERVNGGIQREESKKRIKEITLYCDDPDATFPTPIILSVNSKNIKISAGSVEFEDESHYAEVLDGQHRIKGIAKSEKIDQFTLPVVFVIDATEEQKAYIFSIINSKQTRVSPSLIYDLFDVVESRSPHKTCHELARSLNSSEESPFFDRLKMLGKGGGENASLSQGAFVKALLPLISKNPDKLALDIKNNADLTYEDLPFSKYFIEGKDEIIFKIIINLFNAVSDTFPNEWNNPKDFILSKSIGFTAIIRAYPSIHNVGLGKKDLSRDFFRVYFREFKDVLLKTEYTLTSRDFNASEASLRRLTKLLEDTVNNIV